MSRKPSSDAKTREAAERHRTHPEPHVDGQTTRRQLHDTDGEGGVGGSLRGIYRNPNASDASPRRSPEEDGELDYERAHAEEGDGSDDFTSGRAEEAMEAERGPSEVTRSLTSSGVMEDNLDLNAEDSPDPASQKP